MAVVRLERKLHWLANKLQDRVHRLTSEDLDEVYLGVFFDHNLNQWFISLGEWDGELVYAKEKDVDLERLIDRLTRKVGW